MENHLHIIWQLQAGKKREEVQRDLLKYIAQQIEKDMTRNHPDELMNYKVHSKDRKYQFWERNPLSIEIWSEEVLVQKLKYIHENPVGAALCKYPDEYKYSSSLFYKFGKDKWGFLTHLRD